MSLSQMIKKYGGQWVALKPNTSIVVTSGMEVKVVHKSAQDKGIEIPTLFKVPMKLTPYIG